MLVVQTQTQAQAVAHQQNKKENTNFVLKFVFFTNPFRPKSKIRRIGG